MFNRIKLLTGISIALLLSGCLVGGSSSNGPITSTLSFPLQGAYKSFVANGFTDAFTIYGTSLSVTSTCGGTGNQTITPASAAATFEGVSGFSAVDTLTMAMTSCAITSIASTVTWYYDSNYTPLGYDNPGVEYGVYANPASIPSSVKVGDAGLVGSISLYTDNTKTAGAGRVDVTYVVAADTANTAIVNLIYRKFDTSDTAISTEQDSYRISQTGALAPVSVQLQVYSSSLSLTDTFN